MTENSKNWLWILGIGAASVALWYLCSLFYRRLSESIHTWEPDSDAKDEQELRKSLARHLRLNLPATCKIIEEYGKERSRIDIAIAETSFEHPESEKYAIELKFKLKRKTDIDRLMGQILGYKNLGFGKTFIVSVSSESNMREILSHRTQDEALVGRLALIEK